MAQIELRLDNLEFRQFDNVLGKNLIGEGRSGEIHILQDGGHQYGHVYARWTPYDAGEGWGEFQGQPQGFGLTQVVYPVRELRKGSSGAPSVLTGDLHKPRTHREGGFRVSRKPPLTIARQLPFDPLVYGEMRRHINRLSKIEEQKQGPFKLSHDKEAGRLAKNLTVINEGLSPELVESSRNRLITMARPHFPSDVPDAGLRAILKFTNHFRGDRITNFASASAGLAGQGIAEYLDRFEQMRKLLGLSGGDDNVLLPFGNLNLLDLTHHSFISANRMLTPTLTAFFEKSHELNLLSGDNEDQIYRQLLKEYKTSILDPLMELNTKISSLSPDRLWDIYRSKVAARTYILRRSPEQDQVMGGNNFYDVEKMALLQKRIVKRMRAGENPNDMLRFFCALAVPPYIYWLIGGNEHMMNEAGFDNQHVYRTWHSVHGAYHQLNVARINEFNTYWEQARQSPKQPDRLSDLLQRQIITYG